MARGIYLVANRPVERETALLIHTLREAGCRLPIVLIPFDARAPVHPHVVAETSRLAPEDFPAEGRALLAEIAALWPRSQPGLFRRLLAWYGPFDEFIYSDNDIVALADWTGLFDYLGDHHFLHMDREYLTQGIYAYARPEEVRAQFGPGALETVFTTGHFVSRKSPEITAALAATVPWLRAHPGVAFEVDGPFLHLATLIGGLRLRNMCRPPDHWPSSWARDYRNALELVQASQRGGKLFQLHYSGGKPSGFTAADEFLCSGMSDAQRMRRHMACALKQWSGFNYIKTHLLPGLRRRLRMNLERRT